MEQIPNHPKIGECSYCGRLSVRLLNAPLLKIPARDTTEYERSEDCVWWKSCVAPASLYDVIERDGDYLICLASESGDKDRQFCYRCFDGQVSPSERDNCINMPREMYFTPGHEWWPVKWVSVGRELARRSNKVLKRDVPSCES